MTEVNAVLVIAQRDFLKFVRDPARVISTIVFPLIFIGILGGSLQSNLGSRFGFNFLTFTFTGVLAQTLFQSSAMGVISLVEDRANDFSQEIFVSPVSRYTIIFGKIVGESLVALPQGLAVVAFAVILRIPVSPPQLIALIPTAVAICLFGGAFGVVVLANLSSQRAANQIFPFIMFPQFFLAGVFNPVRILPFYLDILSRITPMRYAVDLARGAFYFGQPEYGRVVLAPPLFDLAVIAALFAVFLSAGTVLFVRGERNR
jgi:ABC-2 type transport system permease protein